MLSRFSWFLVVCLVFTMGMFVSNANAGELSSQAFVCSHKYAAVSQKYHVSRVKYTWRRLRKWNMLP